MLTNKNNSEKCQTKWYNSKQGDVKDAILRFALANRGILHHIDMEQGSIIIYLGTKELIISINEDKEKTAVDLAIKTTLFKADKLAARFFHEIGLFLEGVDNNEIINK